MGRPKLPTPEKYCEYCGKKLERRPLSSGYSEPMYWFLKRRYCSLACAGKARTARMMDTPAPTAKQSRVRARTKTPPAPCGICGKVGYTEVHHRDKNPMNNSSENLIRLCKSCHVRQHRKRSLCVVCGKPVKGHHLCQKHWQALRKSLQRGWDTEYTLMIKQRLNALKNQIESGMQGETETDDLVQTSQDIMTTE